jgi:hypothetical protein
MVGASLLATAQPSSSDISSGLAAGYNEGASGQGPCVTSRFPNLVVGSAVGPTAISRATTPPSDCGLWNLRGEACYCAMDRSRHRNLGGDSLAAFRLKAAARLRQMFERDLKRLPPAIAETLRQLHDLEQQTSSHGAYFRNGSLKQVAESFTVHKG